MAREPELRRRVEQLLRGQFNQEHLTRLYLWLRSRSYGIASVREIGHFVAHADERSVGPVTDEVRDFFTFARLWVPLQSRRRNDQPE
jgi:hypothetical protein